KCPLVMYLILSPRYLFVFFCRGWARLGRAVRGWDLALVFWNIKDGQGFRYLHNYRSGIFQNREDWCIWLGLFTLQFVWQFGPGLWCGRGEWGIIPRRSSDRHLVHIWLDNSTTTRGMRSAMGSKC
ncbi:hypothetical protein BDDG_13673, partial [Blastomyces dermatitidis ATCC 18188]